MRLLAHLVLIGLLAVWPYLLQAPFLTHIGVMVALYATLALSMNLMLRIGQISFAHGAFMGLGAYGSALFMMRLDLPFVLAFPAAGLAVTVLAWLAGKIFLRVRGVYFVLLTFAFGEIVVLTFVEWVSLFGGSNGLVGVPRPIIAGFEVDDRNAFYLLALALAVAAWLAVRAIYRSEIGGVIVSLDENEALSRSLGIDSSRYRLLTFCFSAFLAALAGALYGHYLMIVTPDDYGFWVPVNLVVINVVGGIANPLGALLGTLVLVPLPELLRDANQYQVLLYGLLLIVFLLFLPDGLYGALKRLRPGRRRVVQ